MSNKNLFVFLFLFSLASGTAWGKCKLATDGVKVTWTAYKTAKEVPVSGTFNNLNISGTMKGKSVSDILTKVKANIDTATVNTKNLGRDKIISKNFFLNSRNSKNVISGSVSKLSKKSATFVINMYGVKKAIDFPLTYDKKSGQLMAKTKFDFTKLFNMTTNYKGIAKACKAKHNGVTSPFVEIKIEGKFGAGCNLM